VQPQGQKRGAATLTEFLVATAAAAAAAAAAAHNKVPVYEHLKDYLTDHTTRQEDRGTSWNSLNKEFGLACACACAFIGGQGQIRKERNQAAIGGFNGKLVVSRAN
jgi:hypothetical protein